MFRVAFFVDDRRLADVLRMLVDIARGAPEVTPVEQPTAALRQHAPARNTKQARADAPTERLFIDEMKKRMLTVIRADDARDICKSIGLSPTSYQHALKMCVKAHALKKSGKGQKMHYTLVE